MKLQDFMDSFENTNELPLDNIIEGGGFCGIFRSIACIGDSLSSGEFESHNSDGSLNWNDIYDYS